MRSSDKECGHSSTCTCLVDAFRAFPAQVDVVESCGSPDCPVKSLDTITLRQFLEAIRFQNGGAEDEAGGADDGTEIPIFRAMARRLRQRRPGSGRKGG